MLLRKVDRNGMVAARAKSSQRAKEAKALCSDWSRVANSFLHTPAMRLLPQLCCNCAVRANLLWVRYAGLIDNCWYIDLILCSLVKLLAYHHHGI